MSVVVGDIDAFVSHPIGDGYRRVSHFNQKRNMAVSQIVDSDPLDPCGLGTSVHFVVEIAFCNFKQPVVFADSVELFHIVLHFLTEKLRHLDRPIAFRRFRVSDDVPAADALIRFVDRDRLPFKIEIRRGQRQQFCFCQYKSKKNLLLIRKKHHCFHPVMLLRTILFRLCFFFFVENVIHLPAYLHTTWFINKDFLNNL